MWSIVAEELISASLAVSGTVIAKTMLEGMVNSDVRKSFFISFEGIDGAGKSTHIDALVAAFKAEHGADKVIQTREPGGTPLAEKLRQLILNDAMDALTESFLVFAARRDHLNQVVEPALARGDVVLCDRFTDATFAYQGGGRGFDLNTLSILERFTQAIPASKSSLAYKLEGASAVERQDIRQPDLTLWFDLPPEIAAERLAGARVPDKFEAQPVEFFRQVVAGYQQRMDASPERFAKINANQSREAVWADVLQAVETKGFLRKGIKV
jgi:dTMP kinase